MATDIASKASARFGHDPLAPSPWQSAASVAYKVVAALASLKLTVALFAMAIFLIFTGTLAQVQKDIWEVVHQYFRAPLAWIEFDVFFPPSFFPDIDLDQVHGGFWFPGGWTIGGLMFINLLAAHGLRFKVQAKGQRLFVGLGVIALGAALTWLVVTGGSDKAGLDGQSAAPSVALWRLLQVAIAGAWVSIAFALPRIDPGRKWERWLLIAGGVTLGGLLAWMLYRGDEAIPSGASLRILWQLIKGGLAAGVLLAGCLLVFRKRAGIVLLHGGILLMMVNELVVHGLHKEGYLQVAEGEAVNFVSDGRTIELAVVDTSHPDRNHVVVIPKSKLLADEIIDHELLPFKVEVDEFFQNSTLLGLHRGQVVAAGGETLITISGKTRRSFKVDPKAEVLVNFGQVKLADLRPGLDVQVLVNLNDKIVQVASPPEPNPATAGFGTEAIVRRRAAGTGTDNDPKFDMSSAYMTFYDKQTSQPLGTFMMTQRLGPQTVQLGEKSYEVALRAERTYKPYAMQLLDVRKVDYLGTATAKSYESDVRLVDPTANVDRKIKIWMNNPLRYAGETFYQSGYEKDATGREMTSLQVVTNTGWMIPYVGCVIVGVGLLAHFWLTLVRFLKRRAAAVPEVAEPQAVEPAAPAVARATVAGKKRKRAQASAPEPEQPRDWKPLAARYFPAFVVVLLALWLIGRAVPPRSSITEFDLYEFGKLPVAYEGRLKPFDTLARNSLRIISDKETFKDSSDVTQPAIRWLLDVITRPGAANNHKVFRIEHPEVLNILGLEARKGFRYSIHEMPQAGRLEFQAQVELAREIEPDNRNAFEKKVLEVDKRIRVFTLLQHSFSTPALPKLPSEEETAKNPQAAMAAFVRFKQEIAGLRQRNVMDREKYQPPRAVPLTTLAGGWDFYASAVTEGYDRQNSGQPVNAGTVYVQDILSAFAQGNAGRFNTEVRAYRAYLDRNLTAPEEDVLSLAEPIAQTVKARADAIRLAEFYRIMAEGLQHGPPDIKTAADLLQAHRDAWELGFDPAFGKKQATVFDSVGAMLSSYLEAQQAETGDLSGAAISRNGADVFRALAWELRSDIPDEYNRTKLGYEAFFNHFQPYRYASLLYVLAFVLAALAWLGWSGPLNKAAFYVVALTLALHTFALISRIYISGRPPVTNLYSSAVFIGWACVVFGMVYEVLFKLGIGNVIAGAVGFATLLIADSLAADGDTITVLLAVLDTQFWLATHVVCITLGYATTFLAGGLGIIYVLRGVLTPSLTPQVGKELSRMIYGTLCFSIFFSFVGTVLGGLWADDSWGRFWGWDPKENGALIIVLWNALCLHARWGGMVKERGLAVLVVGGNIVTAWSWFGVNELGKGLHSYGFTDGVLLALALFVASQLAIIAAGCLPKEKWWSFRQHSP